MFGRPTAICTYLAPITTTSLEAEVMEVERKTERARRDYVEKLAEHRRVFPVTTDAEVMDMEVNGKFARPGLSYLRCYYTRIGVLEQHLEHVRELARLLRPTPAKLRVMVVEAGDLSNALRERGYRFERDGYWSAAGTRSRSAWCKRVLADEISLGLLAVELAGLGVEIEADGCLGEVVASVKYKMAQVEGSGL